jgi:DNA-binding transcriptional LysR family regulator
MDTEKCKILLTAVQTGSMSAAAAELGYTPSGVTRAINALEKELGFPVLARTAKGVALTKDGERILPALRELVHWDRHIQELGAQIRGLVAGEITIGAYFSVAANWLPPIIRAFQEAYPDIRIHIAEGGNSQLRNWLEERKIDCVILSERHPYQGDWIFLQRDELMVWLPLDHRRARDAAFPVSELPTEDFIEELPGLDTDVEWLRRTEPLKLNVKFTAADNYTTYRMVEAGLGVGINNKLMTASWHGNVVVLPMEPPHYINLGIAIPSLKEASPAVRTFITYIKQWVRQASQAD